MSGTATADPAPAAAALSSPPPAAAMGAPQAGDAGGLFARDTARLATLQQQKQDLQGPIYEQMQKDYQKDRARFDKMADSYKPVEQTPPPQQPENDPLKAFGSFASLFALAASAFTHTPAINAMNGMAAAINATKQNDVDAYNRGYKQWKDSTEIAIQNHKLQSEDMKSALEMMQTDLSSGVARAKAVAAQTDDQVGMIMLNEGRLDKYIELTQTRDAAAQRMAEGAPLADAALNLRRSTAAFQEAQKSGDPTKVAAAAADYSQAQQQYAFAKNPSVGAARPGTPQYVTQQVFEQIKRDHPETTDADAWTQAMQRVSSLKTPTSAAGAKEHDADILARARFAAANGGRQPGPNDDVAMAEFRTEQRQDAPGVITDKAASFIAGRIWAGDEAATTGLARSAANMRKVANAVVEEAERTGKSPEDLAIKIAEFQGTKQAARTLGVRAVNIEVPANEVRYMAPVALEASDKVDRTEYPDLNAILLAGEKRTGDPNVVRFGLATNSLIYTYAKFLNPTGIPTDSDKARATDILATAWSKGQFAAAVDQILTKEIPSGESAITQTRKQLEGGLTTQTAPTGAPSQTAKPPAVPKAAPREGETNVSKSGKPIVFRNGKWEYQ